MITLHLCGECNELMEEFAGFYRCTNLECDMCDELIDEDEENE